MYRNLILGMILVLVVGGITLSQRRAKDDVAAPTSEAQTSGRTIESPKFGRQKKAAHFETSTPPHEAVYPAVPSQVVIDFNFDLGAKSKISVTSGGKEYSAGDVMIDANILTMRKNLDTTGPDGIYDVNYEGCWPDNSCHKGFFQFKVDRSLAAGYTDMRGQKEVVIPMKDIAFAPQSIRVSKGTKITWVNNDEVVHYVNTDSHPAHTYYIAQNTRAIKKGESYALGFDQPGIYPYHCSAHLKMTGNILVE